MIIPGAYFTNWKTGGWPEALGVPPLEMTVEDFDGETCDDCGGRYERTIWTAPDELWIQLVGREGGLLCPPCFDDRAKAVGLFLRWVPHAEMRFE